VPECRSTAPMCGHHAGPMALHRKEMGPA
jgi:hypothetical protein